MTPMGSIWIIGDIQGCCQPLSQLLRHADIANDPNAQFWFAGDLVNRGPHSLETLNLIRAFTQGGFADLREVHSWNKGFAENPANQRYEGLAKEIDRAVKFMEAAGADFDELRRVEFYTGHEGLLMDYERPMTRIDSRTGTPASSCLRCRFTMNRE